MLKYKIFLLITLFSQFISSQEIIFEYSQVENRSMDRVKFVYKEIVNDNYSISTVKDINDITQIENFEEFSAGNKTDSIVSYLHNTSDYLRFVRVPLTKIFKDYKNNSILLSSPDNIKSNHKIIKDSLDIFHWEISNEKDTLILNYKCKKATTKFRGRDYVAYFSNEIANQGGPWKFDGLPGFIVKVNSIDGFLNIDPISIKKNNSIIEQIKNPFESKKTIPFTALKDIILEQEKDHVKRIKSKNSYFTGYTIPAGFKTIEDIGLNHERKYE